MRAILENYLWPELDELDINDMWFQQDGNTSHTARVTIDFFKGKFGEHIFVMKIKFNHTWEEKSDYNSMRTM